MTTESLEVVEVTRKNKCSKFQGMSVVLGGILVHLTMGTIYTYGNMAPYFVSYMRKVGSSPNLTYKESSWIFACAATCQGLFGGVGGLIERKLGPRPTVLIGCLLVSGVALTYFTINHGFFYLLMTYGGMFGTGIGIAYYVPIGCAMRWFPNHKGFTAGLVVGGFGGGAFIFNQVMTALINPLNLTPDVKIDHNYFFSQPEVLNNVPKCLLIISGIYITMQLIGILFICNPSQEKEVIVKDFDLSNLDKNSEKSVKSIEAGAITIEEITKNDKIPEEEVQRDMTPCQTLRTKTFYHLWFLLFFINHTSTVISAFYKAYGQTFIKDDHFLSLVGAVSSICNASGRVLWGLLADRTSFQIALMCLTTSISCLYSLFNVTELLGGKAVFLIFVCLIFLSFSGIFSTFPSVTMRCFGSTYYSANFGFLCTGLAASNISSSFLSHMLYEHIGYHGLFFVASGLASIGCLLAFLFKEPINIA